MKNQFRIIIAIILFIGACSEIPTDNKATRSKPKSDDISVLAALPLDVPTPADNPTTKEKVALGKLLFFDPILSGNKDVACATCHHPEFGFSESLEISIGVNGKGLGSKRDFVKPNDIPFVKRNSQTVLNTAFNGITNGQVADATNAPMFWDVRAKSLENQALEPIMAFEEMRGHTYAKEEAVDKVLERLRQNSEYARLFEGAFETRNAINRANLGKAIAAYERTLIGNNSRFDQFMRGNKSVLSENEIDGLKLFVKSGCTKCHNGPMFSDFKTHVLGVADNEKLGFSDDGTDKTYAFRTPTLRNLRFTAPYMHSGKLKTLQNVLEFYEDLAGRTIANPHVKPEQLDTLTKQLNVNFKDISTIIDFLNTLNDPDFDKTIPAKVPSGLKVGGNIN